VEAPAGFDPKQDPGFNPLPECFRGGGHYTAALMEFFAYKVLEDHLSLIAMEGRLRLGLLGAWESDA
jgi:hypothetical protein